MSMMDSLSGANEVRSFTRPLYKGKAVIKEGNWYDSVYHAGFRMPNYRLKMRFKGRRGSTVEMSAPDQIKVLKGIEAEAARLGYKTVDYVQLLLDGIDMKPALKNSIDHELLNALIGGTQ